MAAPCCASGASSGGPAGWLAALGAGAVSSAWAGLMHLPPEQQRVAAACVLAPLLTLPLAAWALLLLFTPAQVPIAPSERTFRSASGDDGTDAAAVALPPALRGVPPQGEKDVSIVVPAFNETERLPQMLDEALAYLSSGGFARAVSGLPERLRGTQGGFEVVVVDDGSTDGTSERVLRYARAHGDVDIRVVRLAVNRGKGAAVRHGMLHSRGEMVLFADADGATRFSDLGRLLAEMARIASPRGYGIVVGSRAHLVGSEATVKRSWVRNLLMYGFHFMLSLLLHPPSVPLARAGRLQQPTIADTQCGFKLFTRKTVAHILPLAHIDRWIFDVELLLLAETASSSAQARAPPPPASQGVGPSGPDGGDRDDDGSSDGAGAAQAVHGGPPPAPETVHLHSVREEDALVRLPLPIGEVAVAWHEISGSKVDLLRDSIRMGRDLVVLRLNYALGRWARPLPVPV